MKIYTRVGDRGQTGLFGGPRVAKDDLRIEAYGTIDELNAVLGVVRAAQPPAAIDEVLKRVQNQLFTVGAQLATPQPVEKKVPMIHEEHVTALEADIDSFENCMRPLAAFILPGGTNAAAMIHLARAVCRRAERRIVSYVNRGGEEGAKSVTPELLAYVNRLSDLLFVLARATNQHASRPDVPWQKNV
jgi:cob(I)alamin adenosyltransferase